MPASAVPWDPRFCQEWHLSSLASSMTALENSKSLVHGIYNECCFRHVGLHAVSLVIKSYHCLIIILSYTGFCISLQKYSVIVSSCACAKVRGFSRNISFGLGFFAHLLQVYCSIISNFFVMHSCSKCICNCAFLFLHFL